MPSAGEIVSMELTALRYFVAVAEELHFGRAAARLHMSQPPVSRQVKNLEDELGLSLFRRTSRRVELTAAGQSFLSEARAILERTETALCRMQDLAEGHRGTLSVGFHEPAISSFLPEAIRRFRETYPTVALDLREEGTEQQLRSIATGIIHMALIRPFRHDLSAYRTCLLLEEPYVLAVSAEEPPAVAAQGPVPLQALEHVPQIMFSRHVQPRLYDAIGDAFRTLGIRPQIVQEAATKHTILALVRCGLGVAIVPASSARLMRQGLRFLPLEAGLPTVEIMAVWRREMESPVVRNFVRLCRESLKPADRLPPPARGRVPPRSHTAV